VDAKFELSDKNFTGIHLPNEKNFVEDPRPDMPENPVAKLCMKNCKTDVKITKRAAVVNVTPTDDKNPSASID